MLQLFRNRLVTCLLTVVYLTAGAAGNLLHSHAHGHDHDGAAGDVCQHAHGHDEHGEHGQQDHAATNAQHGLMLVAASAGHHDDCTICRAAGQRMVPVQCVQFTASFGLVEPLRLAVTSEPPVLSPRTHQSRAPPRAS